MNIDDDINNDDKPFKSNFWNVFFEIWEGLGILVIFWFIIYFIASL